ncbi:MAG: hypothetical protein U5L45_20625 [Saprospiraceae bacterium]|nr:hypothetical protein [Saprospiraceae bacterium]
MSYFAKIIALMVVIFFTHIASSSAQLPNTQVYAFDLGRDGAGFTFLRCKMLTAFNPYGYNNQPQWVNNNELYLAVQFPNDTNQTDIWSLSLLNNVITRVTATAESEYSPTLMPDNRTISCVRVDVGESGTQRLWSYPLDRSSTGADLISLHPNVGYHTWLTDKELALFMVDGTNNYLKLVNVDDQSSIQLTFGIGRSLARMKDGKLAFVHKETPQKWVIKTMHPTSYKSTNIAETVQGSEDFALLSDGTFLMGFGPKIFALYPSDPKKEWVEVADLSKFGLTNIKRIAVNRDGDRIAIVNDLPRR